MNLRRVLRIGIVSQGCIFFSVLLFGLLYKSPAFIFSIVFLAPLVYVDIRVLKYIKQKEKLLSSISSKIGINESSFFVSLQTFFESYLYRTNMLLKENSNHTEEMSTQLNMLKDIIYNVAVVMGRLRSIKEEMNGLSANIVQSSSASIQISRTIDSFLHLIENQTAAITETSAAVEESTASMKNIRRNISNSKDKSETLFTLTKTSEEVMYDTNNTIAEIVEKVSAIEDAIHIIESISSQTNLLAMNAAIEAAHAGDAGRGFAVVADEIRKLAETSSDNSQIIGKSLNSIISDVDKVKNSGVKSYENFSLVSEEVGEFIKSLNEIDAATEEILHGSEEILNAVTDLTSVSTSIESGSKEMAGSIDEITNAITEIQEMAHRSASHLEDVGTATIDVSKSISGFTEQNIKVSTYNHNILQIALNRSSSKDTIDIKTIIQQHLLWVSKVRMVLDGQLSIESETIGDHTTCDLGRALISSQAVAWKKLPFYQNLINEHERIHTLIKSILQNTDNLNQQQLEEKFNMLIEVSGDIIELLFQLLKAVDT